MKKEKTKKGLWGGRFKKGMHPVLKCFSYSLYVDHHLFDAEIRVDIAWVKMLRRAGFLSVGEAASLTRGLGRLGKKFEDRDPHSRLPEKWRNQYEDVHTLIQTELEKLAGPAAKKIHTGRSRNDLVVTSTRLYLKDKIAEIDLRIRGLQSALISLAEKAGSSVIAGMTHLRKAQPVLMAHHLLAYVEMLEEDRERILDAAKRVDVLALGSAALAGSSLPIDQAFLARELGFSKIAPNSMAATADRAFIAEVIGALAILWMHLARLSEDFILWNNEAFGYIELDDAFATGSSLMPQKKNPDVFELIRGRSAVIAGHLQTILSLQKGLPLAYNRDLQEDKPLLFDAVNKTDLGLQVLALTIASTSIRPDAMSRSVEDDALFATDILEYLVRKGMPFTEAHETVGHFVRLAAETDRNLREIHLEEWQKASKLIQADIYDLFDAGHSVRAKRTIGSTHPNRVQSQLAAWKKKLRSIR